jgi:hypothetical protein
MVLPLAGPRFGRTGRVSRQSSLASDWFKWLKRDLAKAPLAKLSTGLLHAFLVVAEVGKISEAARQLHLSQPAVTAQIR